MRGGSVYHMERIEIDDDESQGLLTAVNVRSAPFMPQARDTKSHGRTTQNQDVNLLSHIDEKSDIDIGLNEVVVPKTSKFFMDPRITFII